MVFRLITAATGEIPAQSVNADDVVSTRVTADNTGIAGYTGFSWIEMWTRINPGSTR